MIPSFDQQIRESDCFNASVYQKDRFYWKRLEYLYNQNYINNQNTTQNIPKIIHHIWLGGKLPDKYQKYIDSWKKFNPTWEHLFWDDTNIKALNIDKLDQTKNLGQKSDILRYNLLYKYGGIYVDTDFECLKSFDDLLHLKFFTGIAYPSTIEMYIGLLASAPEHPIIKSCIDNMGEIKYKTPVDVISTTGNYHFTKCFLDIVMSKESDSVVAFPMSFFYPFPNTTRDTCVGEERARFIKEWSYAIHHWGVSWL
jgi:mannosyltransferase OCH1-like enzyme